MGCWLLMTCQAKNWEHWYFVDWVNVSWAFTFLWNHQPKRFFWERADPLWAITRLLMLITTPAAHKTGFSRDKTARTFEHKRIKFEQTYNICFHHVHQATIEQKPWITLEWIYEEEGTILLWHWLFSTSKQVYTAECIVAVPNRMKYVFSIKVSYIVAKIWTKFWHLVMARA